MGMLKIYVILGKSPENNVPSSVTDLLHYLDIPVFDFLRHHKYSPGNHNDNKPSKLYFL